MVFMQLQSSPQYITLVFKRPRRTCCSLHGPTVKTVGAGMFSHSVHNDSFFFLLKSTKSHVSPRHETWLEVLCLVGTGVRLILILIQTVSAI